MQGFEKWTETYTQLLKIDQGRTLEPKDIETLALAAYLTGKEAESFQLLQRAHQSYLAQNKTQQAARCIIWLGLMLINAGEMARGSGWIAKAERLLHDEKVADCAEKGLLLIPAALKKLGTDAFKAQKLFEQATKIGEQFDDIDLISLGRLGQGQAMIQQGQVAKGIKRLDEAMITVVSEQVSPFVNGLVYCAVIETCRKVWDLERAQEWTSALTRWCETHPDMVPFKGQCLVRRAEIIQLHGEWPKALEESRDACLLLTRPPGEPAAGEAYYRQAELHRLLGNFEEAEDTYREAAKWGRKPQPGLALLRLAQGQDDAAETSIRNTLMETRGAMRRAELLPAFVRIMVAVKQTKEAQEGAIELSSTAKEFDAPYLHAISAHCQGGVFLAQGKVQMALAEVLKALKIWDALRLPYESACTRELNGLVYQELNDKDNSDAALAAAQWFFEQLKAKPDLERVNRLLNKNKHYETHGLTLRELQVLRLVASGKTNKSIANELFISERTVDRHVSNIFSKLGVSSRVAATTFALTRNMMDNQP